MVPCSLIRSQISGNKRSNAVKLNTMISFCLVNNLFTNWKISKIIKNKISELLANDDVRHIAYT
jgi:hypothetical protein